MTDTQKAAQVQKMQMMDALEKVKAETVVYEKKVRKQTELMDKNKEEIMSCEKKMTDLVEDLIRDLREHERIMKTKFAEIYEAQEKHHATQVENFELVLTQLKSCVERGETIVQRNISAEILQTNQAIVKRCEELLKARKPDIYKPSHVNYMVEQKVKILDRIVVSDTDPSLSLAEVASLKDVREKLETNFTIVTRNSDEGQCYQEEDVITVNILNPAGDQLETEIKDAKDGKYTVTYTLYESFTNPTPHSFVTLSSTTKLGLGLPNRVMSTCVLSKLERDESKKYCEREFSFEVFSSSFVRVCESD